MKTSSARRAVKIAATLILAGVAVTALAAVLTFTWVNATHNTDGSTIPASGAGALTETRVTYGTCNAGRTAIASIIGTVITTAPGQSGATANLPPGIYCGSAQNVNSFGSISAPSNVASKEVVAPVPNPPTNFGFG